MLRTTILTAATLVALSLTAPAALAGTYVYNGYGVHVNVNGHHHMRRHAVQYVTVRPRHNHIYYASNGYQYPGYHSYIRHYEGSTYAYGYPGVSVFIGSGGGLSVSVGF